ncbi:MAG: hypothetical protein KKC46_02465 [Proteobacteria bacterium]|nr:hypothetical protein [Pseudomonadota bacterium]
MCINKFKLRENVFITSIFVIILEYQLSFVHTFLFDRIIKIVFIAILIIFFKNIRDNKKNIYIQRVTKIYLAIFFVMIVSTVANLSVLSVSFLIRYSLLLLIVFILLYKVHPYYFSDRIIKFVILIGVAFSLSSIVLWILVFLGFEPHYFNISSERFTRIDKFSYLWGDLHYAFSGGGIGGFTRVCSFFETPNRYGNFLIFPIFVSYGYFVLKRRFIYLIACVLCSVVMFLTLSLTIFLVVMAAILLSIFFTMVCKIKEFKMVPNLAGFGGLILALILMICIFEFYQIQYEKGDSPVFRGGEYKTLFRAFSQQKEAFIPKIERPFGEGLAYMKNGKLYTSQYGFVRWVVLLGYPGLICFIIFITYMFQVHVFPALIHRPLRIEYYVALAFFAQTISGIEEGSWLSTNYLFTTAILVLLKKYEFKERKRFHCVRRLERVKMKMRPPY